MYLLCSLLNYTNYFSFKVISNKEPMKIKKLFYLQEIILIIRSLVKNQL